jgi:hypothetical protein
VYPLHCGAALFGRRKWTRTWPRVTSASLSNGRRDTVRCAHTGGTPDLVNTSVCAPRVSCDAVVHVQEKSGARSGAREAAIRTRCMFLTSCFDSRLQCGNSGIWCLRCSLRRAFWGDSCASEIATSRVSRTRTVDRPRAPEGWERRTLGLSVAGRVAGTAQLEHVP